MKKIIAIIMAMVLVTFTGCGIKPMTEEEIELNMQRGLYEDIVGKDPENLTISEMQREICKTELEKVGTGYWTYESEYDRVQTFHSYMGDGMKIYIVYDLDTGEALEYGVE